MANHDTSVQVKDLTAAEPVYIFTNVHSNYPQEGNALFLNSYHCPECGEEWEDPWSCTCNDDCPHCNIDIEPEKSPAVHVLPMYGGAVWLSEWDGKECLQGCALNDDGSLDLPNGYDLTAPESQEFLDAVNKVLGTKFDLSQFAGR